MNKVKLQARAAEAALDSWRERRHCRVCFEERSTSDNPLISPCMCKGSQRFIHLRCLRIWQRHALSSRNRRRAFCCNVCKTPFSHHPISDVSLDFLSVLQSPSFHMIITLLTTISLCLTVPVATMSWFVLNLFSLLCTLLVSLCVRGVRPVLVWGGTTNAAAVAVHNAGEDLFRSHAEGNIHHPFPTSASFSGGMSSSSSSMTSFMERRLRSTAAVLDATIRSLEDDAAVAARVLAEDQTLRPGTAAADIGPSGIFYPMFTHIYNIYMNIKIAALIPTHISLVRDTEEMEGLARGSLLIARDGLVGSEYERTVSSPVFLSLSLSLLCFPSFSFLPLLFLSLSLSFSLSFSVSLSLAFFKFIHIHVHIHNCKFYVIFLVYIYLYTHKRGDGGGNK